MKIKYNLVSE